MKDDYENAQQSASVMGLSAGANQCSREPTPKEVLGRYIEKCSHELMQLKALYAALPDEMSYAASCSLIRIIESSFSR